MALPNAYLTTVKNLEATLNAIKTAQAPDKFSQKFLESLEFTSSSDRLMVGILKALKFISDDGKPTQRYFDFLDQTQSAKVLAEGIKEAYADLFAVNINAHQLSREDVINKFRTLSQGQLSDSVLDKMAMTFTALIKYADFSSPRQQRTQTEQQVAEKSKEEPQKTKEEHGKAKISGLAYNIHLILPESRDPAVYDALFKSLKDHLL
jgi:hypothetical protein